MSDTVRVAERIEAGADPSDCTDVNTLLRAAFEYEDAARTLRHLALVAAARLHYTTSAPLRGVHPYIKSIGLAAVPDGVHQDDEGWLVVPALALTPAGRAVVGCERISPTGDVRTLPALFQRGSTFEVGQPSAALTAYCLDLGSALLACDVLPQAKAVVCFDAENLGWVVKRAKGSLVVIEDEIGYELVTQVAARKAMRASPYATPSTYAKAAREEIAGRLMGQVRWVA